MREILFSEMGSYEDAIWTFNETGMSLKPWRENMVIPEYSSCIPEQ